MLKITIREDEQAVGFTLSGRLAGPWVDELKRAWSETAPRLGSRALQLDLRELTYSDATGKRTLRAIYTQTKAEMIAGTLSSQHLADEITNANANGNVKGTKGAANGNA